MNRLLDIGFVPVGHWLLNAGELRFELTRHSSQKNILYAFACDGEVKYVGKTVRPLMQRMRDYANPRASQSTNVNNHERIKALLEKDVAVEILALPDNGLHHYGQFHLNLAAGLEDDIIRVTRPEWNGGRVEQTSARSEVEASTPVGQEAKGSFQFTLQPTYLRTGFFNVLVADQHHIGADGESVEIFLGDAEQPVLGTINRRANGNGTPRIMGGPAVRDWFANQAEVMAKIEVEVYSPTAIRLVLPSSGISSKG